MKTSISEEHVYIGFGCRTGHHDRSAKGKSLLEIVSNYVVLDLETTGLDPTWNEIIEIGAIRVRNHEIVETFSSLVKPDIPIDDFIASLTGITNEMVADAPAINAILPQLFDFVGNDIVVGHNVNFDINFLYDNSLRCTGRGFTNDFVDTMRLSRRLFPEEAHHRLADLELRFNLHNENAHRAMSDVLLTKECYDYMRRHIVNCDIDLAELTRKTNSKRSTYSQSVRAKDIVATTDKFDESSPVYQKTFVFTGTLQKMTRKDAMQAVVNCGGVCGDTVNKKTNYLVLGNYDFCSTITGGKSSKHKKAEQLKLAGQDISIISENVFYDMLNE